MKSGKIYVETVVLGCPECRFGYAPDPHHGSGFYTESDWNSLAPNSVVECVDCGKKFRKPKRNPFRKEANDGCS